MAAGQDLSGRQQPHHPQRLLDCSRRVSDHHAIAHTGDQEANGHARRGHVPGTAVREVPPRIGPCEFGQLGKLIAVRCPREFDPVMRKAGGQWEPGSRRWLIERRRIGPVIRALERSTDPLFRWAGLLLD
jgi:hypothetical protein